MIRVKVPIGLEYINPQDDPRNSKAGGNDHGTRA